MYFSALARKVLIILNDNQTKARLKAMSTFAWMVWAHCVFKQARKLSNWRNGANKRVRSNHTRAAKTANALPVANWRFPATSCHLAKSFRASHAGTSLRSAMLSQVVKRRHMLQLAFPDSLTESRTLQSALRATDTLSKMAAARHTDFAFGASAVWTPNFFAYAKFPLTAILKLILYLERVH